MGEPVHQGHMYQATLSQYDIPPVEVRLFGNDKSFTEGKHLVRNL
jgi:hypothetical protein